MSRRLVYLVAATLDGFIAGPDRGDPTGSPAFSVPEDLIGLLVSRWPETLPGGARGALGIDAEPTVFDTVLEGRGSYEVGLAAGVPDAYPHLRHVVFSRTPSPGSSAVEVTGEDPATVVRRMKADDGLDLWLVGGGRLAHALLPEIDRLVLKQQPTVLGDGVPLFDGPATDARFAPTDEVLLDSGVRIAGYDRVR